MIDSKRTFSVTISENDSLDQWGLTWAVETATPNGSIHESRLRAQACEFAAQRLLEAACFIRKNKLDA